MLKQERFQIILDQLGQDQKVLLSDLSSILHVSEDTVRRDIRELSDQGLLKAVRGGAVPHAPGPHRFRDRMQYSNEGKQIIAEKALQFVEDGHVIIFDGGTSAVLIARSLPKTIRLSVITNSFPIASILEEYEHIEVFFAGGKLLKDSYVTVGNDAIQFFGKFRPDICFLGICSIHPELGVTGPNFEESDVKRVMIKSSQKVIALSTLEKLGTAESFHVCPTEDLSVIITDRPEELGEIQVYEKMGIRVL
jgi:DeoR/GlpR family transcriptional regulator of sugar metabolism